MAGKVINYTPALDSRITNVDQLPRGTGAPFLLTIKGPGDILIAKSWKRKAPGKLADNEVLISFTKKNPFPFQQHVDRGDDWAVKADARDKESKARSAARRAKKILPGRDAAVLEGARKFERRGMRKQSDDKGRDGVRQAFFEPESRRGRISVMTEDPPRSGQFRVSIGTSGGSSNLNAGSHSWADGLEIIERIANRKFDTVLNVVSPSLKSAKDEAEESATARTAARRAKKKTTGPLLKRTRKSVTVENDGRWPLAKKRVTTTRQVASAGPSFNISMPAIGLAGGWMAMPHIQFLSLDGKVQASKNQYDFVDERGIDWASKPLSITEARSIAKKFAGMGLIASDRIPNRLSNSDKQKFFETLGHRFENEAAPQKSTAEETARSAPKKDITTIQNGLLAAGHDGRSGNALATVTTAPTTGEFSIALTWRKAGRLSANMILTLVLEWVPRFEQWHVHSLNTDAFNFTGTATEVYKRVGSHFTQEFTNTRESLISRIYADADQQARGEFFRKNRDPVTRSTTPDVVGGTQLAVRNKIAIELRRSKEKNDDAIVEIARKQLWKEHYGKLDELEKDLEKSRKKRESEKEAATTRATTARARFKPGQPDLTKTILVDWRTFWTAAKAASAASATDSMRPILMSLALENTGGKLNIVGVDGFRLHRARMNILGRASTGFKDIQIITLAKPKDLSGLRQTDVIGKSGITSLELLKSLKPKKSDEGIIEISPIPRLDGDSKHRGLHFKIKGKGEWSVMISDGSFPDYAKLIPDGSGVPRTTVSQAIMETISKDMHRIAKGGSGIVRFIFAGSIHSPQAWHEAHKHDLIAQVLIEGNGGEDSEHHHWLIPGKDSRNVSTAPGIARAAFDTKFLMESTRVMGSVEWIFQVATPSSPIVLKGSKILQDIVIMPMFVPWGAAQMEGIHRELTGGKPPKDSRLKVTVHDLTGDSKLRNPLKGLMQNPSRKAGEQLPLLNPGGGRRRVKNPTARSAHRISDRDTATMTNGEIVREHGSLDKRQSKIIDTFIRDGFGSLTGEDKRKDPGQHPLIPESLAIDDRIRDLNAEGKRRFGPDLTNVKQLISVRMRRGGRRKNPHPKGEMMAKNPVKAGRRPDIVDSVKRAKAEGVKFKVGPARVIKFSGGRKVRTVVITTPKGKTVDWDITVREQLGAHKESRGLTRATSEKSADFAKHEALRQHFNAVDHFKGPGKERFENPTTSPLRTVPRNRKEHKAAIANATNIHVFTLDNGFRGEKREATPAMREFLAKELRVFKSAKLRNNGGDSYTLRVHSNLWYNFNADVSEKKNPEKFQGATVDTKIRFAVAELLDIPNENIVFDKPEHGQVEFQMAPGKTRFSVRLTKDGKRIRPKTLRVDRGSNPSVHEQSGESPLREKLDNVITGQSRDKTAVSRWVIGSIRNGPDAGKVGIWLLAQKTRRAPALNAESKSSNYFGSRDRLDEATNTALGISPFFDVRIESWGGSKKHSAQMSNPAGKGKANPITKGDKAGVGTRVLMLRRSSDTFGKVGTIRRVDGPEGDLNEFGVEFKEHLGLFSASRKDLSIVKNANPKQRGKNPHDGFSTEQTSTEQASSGFSTERIPGGHNCPKCGAQMNIQGGLVRGNVYRCDNCGTDFGVK